GQQGDPGGRSGAFEHVHDEHRRIGPAPESVGHERRDHQSKVARTQRVSEPASRRARLRQPTLPWGAPKWPHGTANRRGMTPIRELNHRRTAENHHVLRISPDGGRTRLTAASAMGTVDEPRVCGRTMREGGSGVTYTEL